MSASISAWIAVALGGALGSVARHGVNRWVQGEWSLLRFPLATTLVNLAGCAVIGVLAGLIATGRLPMRITLREFVFVGILGGFTTFSTFSLDAITALRAGYTSAAFLSIAIQVIGGLAATYAGIVAVEWLG